MYGKCFRFNGGLNFTGGSIDIKNSSSAGYYYGFDFNVYVPINPKIDYGRFIVHIHNESTKPWTMYNRGLIIENK